MPLNMTSRAGNWKDLWNADKQAQQEAAAEWAHAFRIPLIVREAMPICQPVDIHWHEVSYSIGDIGVFDGLSGAPRRDFRRLGSLFDECNINESNMTEHYLRAWNVTECFRPGPLARNMEEFYTKERGGALQVLRSVSVQFGGNPNSECPIASNHSSLALGHALPSPTDFMAHVELNSCPHSPKLQPIAFAK